MTRTTGLLRLAATAAVALSLGGCISLLPKTREAHLYRFGQPLAAEALTAPQGRIGVFRTNATFQREAAGDRLLTITGGQVAYVADTRWVAPAVVLWDEAVLAAFDADHGPVRLISRGEPAAADYVLRLDVRNFEARYERGAKAAPTVVVRVRAAMTRGADRSVVSERIFETRVVAADNRVGAIVPAYDRAVAEVLKDVVAWTTAEAKPA
ncbi:ABC-type transport auxiliary lipoprotein family protein [Phenylobacterium sp.]|uniref:ABC-type transport auxiliary lipoprotein family protein n=1 Tax=Phenylobacterium sp. TaxID=1871053 RepID=UPI0025DB85B7|nr:ABC-type transport auxiliary lipoprotein family protein [Phenylobacterium sp.]MBX3484040.1 membrane integrity-associated transporter subunit PqiC [Phenylobacterium sp.]MCW5760048.1 membrane integrity-associated transporter subunit PqiC [Phenylobacterium sp.]